MAVGLIKSKIDCPFVISRFERHDDLKNLVLNAINEQKEFNHLYEKSDTVDITRCDWDTSRYDYNREWLKILREPLFSHLENVTKELGYSFFKIKEIWFQQYAKNSVHGWHVHGSNWTNVYYLELPVSCPKTQFIDPYTQSTVNTFDIKEGDILTFPSFVVHRAPHNVSDERKTIISWNMDTELNPGIYSN